MKPIHFVILGVVVVIIIALALMLFRSSGSEDDIEAAIVVALTQTAAVSAPTSTPMPDNTVEESADVIEEPTETSTLEIEPTSTLVSTPTPAPSATTEVIATTPDLVWLAVLEGNFTMGSSEADIGLSVEECNQYEGNCQAAWFSTETPQKTASTDPFEMTKYEITNAQYNLCVEFGPCAQPSRTSSDNSLVTSDHYFDDKKPVVTITRGEAATFCQWVSGRLPTEIEWEKAARGTDERRYPWGNELDLTRANLLSSGPKEVGSYSDGASPYGLLDMAGNVAEFTSDNVIRGGSWKNPPHQGRTTQRSTGAWLTPDFTNFDIGFRCVR